jgi:4-amino-4-deoxy-L-arabinose transferase-like glycosyltransferase
MSVWRENSTPALRKLAWLALLGVIAMVYIFGFQGSRGLSDRSEGRYVAVAMEMLRLKSITRLQLYDEQLHFTKPPLAYATIASSVGLLGKSEWAIRFPYALSFLFTLGLLYGIARIVLPSKPWLPPLIYAVCPLPFLASNFITTDNFLPLFHALMVFAFLKALISPSDKSRRTWIMLLWTAAGLAFLTKGPPALLPILGLLAFAAWSPSIKLQSVFFIPGILLFLLIGLGWYAAAAIQNPGLLEYWLQREVAGRVVSSAGNRNGQWYGWIAIYLPTLLIGSLPWLPWSAKVVRKITSIIKCCRSRAEACTGQMDILTVLWLIVPLVILCAVPSRLPLYLVPTFLPLSILVAMVIPVSTASSRRFKGWVFGWAGVLLLSRFVMAMIPVSQKEERLAQDILAKVHGPISEVVFVQDSPHYGLRFYLEAGVEEVSLHEPGNAEPDTFGHQSESLASELEEVDASYLFIVPPEHQKEFESSIRRAGKNPRPLGQSFDDHLLYRAEEKKRENAKMAASL